MPSDAPARAPTDARQTALARDLCRTMAAIHRRGWCDGTGGNFSCVLQGPPQLQLLMAPSGVDKGRVRASQLLLVDAGGRVLRGQGRASAETALHLEIVARTGAGAVLHTHSQAATLLSRWTAPVTAAPSLSGQHVTTGAASITDPSAPAAAVGTAEPQALSFEGLEMLKGLDGIGTHACRVQLPVLANDQDLTRLSAAAGPHLATAPHGLLIAGHGLYAWGQDLERARRHLEILEFLLEQSWRETLLRGLQERRP